MCLKKVSAEAPLKIDEQWSCWGGKIYNVVLSAVGTLNLKSCKSEIGKKEAVGQGTKSNAEHITSLFLPKGVTKGRWGMESRWGWKLLSQRQEQILCSWEGRNSKAVQVADGGVSQSARGSGLGSQNQVGRDLWSHVVQPTAQTRLNFKVRARCSRLCRNSLKYLF